MIGIIKSQIRKHAEKFRFYDAVTGMSKILRRYFVMNSFDGALTIFGFLLGSFAAGVYDSDLVITIGLSTSIAIGLSGLSGALFTEKAERDRELKSMEKALQRDLDGSEYQKAYSAATFFAAFVDALSPLIAALVLISPFFFVEAAQAYYYSFGLALLIFFGLGAFLGHISKDSLIITGFKMLAAGLISMLLILILGAV